MESLKPDSSALDHKGHRTEVLYGAENAVGRGVEFMKNARKRMDLYYDARAPSIVIEVPEYRNGYLAVKQRGGRIRVITDITKENLGYCKRLMEIVDLRHLGEVKGGLAVNESEYMATTVLEEAKPLTQVIYSNVPELVAQGQHIFNTFWDLATPARYRIEEIEAGIIRQRTTILEDPDKIRSLLARITESSQELNIASTAMGMGTVLESMFAIFKTTSKGLVKVPDSTVMPRIRWVTVITRQNVAEIKKFLEAGAQVRHVSSLPPVSFVLGEGELFAAIERTADGAVARSILNSNELAYVEHFGSIFEKLWHDAVDAADRISELETGVEAASIELIRNHRESIARAWEAITGARHEVLVLFSTPNAFRRQIAMGGADVLRKAHLNGASVRLLIPSGPELGEFLEEFKQRMPEITIRAINERLRTNVTIVLVDSTHCFVFELRDDSRESSLDAVGIALYTTSKSIVSSYSTIVDGLWRESELYEKLEIHDRLQREFINIATHELRTPIQPILGLSEILTTRASAGSEEKELLSAIWRNAKRLNKLAEAILDVTKIESQALNLHHEVFDLNEVVASAIGDLVNSPAVGSSPEGVNISAIYADKKAYVRGDKDRLLQVISNLLSNAVKFVERGSISVLVRIEMPENYFAKQTGAASEKYVTVRVKDSGPGIDPKVLPRLFTKFSTGSTWGTGLGLYISKGIIEAHGGTINASNNADGRGATFSFTLPYTPHDYS